MSAPAPTAPTSTLPQPTTRRWRPLRAGVQNIWQYDATTRFVFHQGRLLLRGRNGSGKTKAVEVLLPFLLEGRLDPSRLDPFRTRSRKMHYNLLHEANRDLTINVGYVWLEFGRRDDDGTERFVTVGAGLKGRRSSDSVDSWFFVVTDRRVDVGLDLFDAERRPLARGPLEESLGDDGRVFQSARDYAAAVNRELFGLSTTQYEALLEAVLRLRQPHLSERLDPIQVGAVLGDSLPPLDADRIAEVAEGFERLESHRRELDDRRRSLTAVDGFLDSYRGYATTVAAVRAAALSAAEGDVRRAGERITAAEREHDSAAQESAAVVAEREQVDLALAAGEARISTLETSDEYRAVKELEGAEQQYGRDADAAAKAVRRRDEDTEALDVARARAVGAQQAAREQREAAAAGGRRASTAAIAADLAREHAGLSAQLDDAVTARVGVDGARGTLGSIAGARREALVVVRSAQQAVAKAEHHQQRAQERRDDAGEQLRGAEAALDRAEDAVDPTLAEYFAEVEHWITVAGGLGLDAGALAPLLELDPADVSQQPRALTAPVRGDIEAAVADIRVRRGELDARRQSVVAERDDLAARTYEPPPSPGWDRADRTERAGAPLYLLVELSDVLGRGEQAAVEAALHAAGLLDAWVTPDGRVPDAGLHDVAVIGNPRASGRTLAEVARPTPAGGISEEVAAAVLARIAVAGAGETPDADTWVATDGRFGIGALRGAAGGNEVRYLGETARTQARERRLAELDRRLVGMVAQDDRLAAEFEQAQEHLQALERHVSSFPSGQAVDEARRTVVTAVYRRDAVRAERDEADAALRAATEAADRERGERDRIAAAHGLAPHVDRLDELADATAAWHAATVEWVSAAAGAIARLELADAREAEQRTALERVERSVQDAAEAEQIASASAERVATLRSMVGADHQQVLADLDIARRQKAALSARQRELEQNYVQASSRQAVAAKELEVATSERIRLDTLRRQAADDLRGLGAMGVLQLVLDRPLEDPASWSLTTTLDHAREVARHGPALPADAEQVRALVESAGNTLARRQQELSRDLVAGIRLFARIDHDVVVHDVQYGGRSFRLPELVAELRDDVAEREARMQGDEQGLLETFLAGELHEHLRSRIRDADALVEVMNTQLRACPTAAGQRVRLQWDISEDAPAGTTQAVDLLLRGAGLLTEQQRGELRAFLQERLREARDGDAAASLHERIAGAFDYRRWHTFTIAVRDRTGSTWRRLTRHSHATGSGGEKAVMLHLPLFAAMAAHYHASPLAPRLIVLDEVFAGIDRGTRGQLMGLLVEMDLDALLTSHEEWGFYAELDGLSTYHLVRDPDVAGVFAEWFVWDGSARWEMGAG